MNNEHTRIKRTFALTRTDILFIVNFVMLGAVMYWTGIVVQPTLDIAETQQKQLDLAVKQNREIIENQNNNSDEIQLLLENQNELLQGQRNATITIEEGMDYFRSNINETFFERENIERMRTATILQNISTIGDKLDNAIQLAEINQTVITQEQRERLHGILTAIRDEITKMEE